jgi:hypothetical protein
MAPSMPAVSAVPWLVAGWIATVIVIAVLIYLIARQVLSKTEPQSMPEVLRALTPLLNVVVRPLAKLPIGTSNEDEPPARRTENNADEMGKEAP